MGQTNRQRVKEWREKKAKEGGRSLSVWMAPETAKRLDEIKETAGESTSLLVARAIAAFHDITCNNEGSAAAEGHFAATDDSIGAIATTFGNKRDFSAIRERLAALLRLRIEEGVSFSALTEELNEAALPAPGGEGPWRRSTIYSLLR